MSGHVMPSFPHTLIGLGPFADQVCNIVFTKTAVTVYHPNGHTILSGWRDETGPHLWHFPLTAKAANPQEVATSTASQPTIPSPPPRALPASVRMPWPLPAPLMALLLDHPPPTCPGPPARSTTSMVQPRLLPWQPVLHELPLTHAALIYPALGPWLDFIMLVLAFQSSRPGWKPSKPATVISLMV
jgi:hypothetical protein